MGRHSLTRRLTAVTLTFALAWSLALISGVTSKASADLVEKIFFTSYDNNQVPEVSAINPDGSGFAVLVPGDSPQSSPDGTKLVFDRHVGHERNDIFVANSDGQNPVDLTPDILGLAGDERWSPDGRKIAAEVDGSVYLLNPDGTPRSLVANRAGYPAWSPDGTRLVLITVSGSSPGDLVVSNVDGSGQSSIAQSASKPVWSPDGRWIAFMSLPPCCSGYVSLSIIHPDGTGLTNLGTGFPGRGVDRPMWSPDGRWIAFVSTQSTPSVSVMHPDGTGVMSLVRGGDNADLVWSPDSSTIVFSAVVTSGGLPPGLWAIDVSGQNLRQIFAGSAARPFWGTQVGTRASTTLTTRASASAPVGSTISDTATLSGGISPSGSITFSLFGPGDTACVAPITSSSTAVSGNGMYTSAHFTATRAGTYRWVASYAGDVNNNAAGPSACDDPNEATTVVQAPTSTGLVSSANPSALHQSVTFTATVLPRTATGSIEFKEDGVDIAGCGAVILSSGAAVCSTSSLAVGEHAIVAVYSGDGNFLGSTSSAITQEVFDQIVTGTVPGSIIVPAGQSFLISGGTIAGSVVASRASRVFICASTVHGTVAVSDSSGFGFIGDAIPGDEGQSCGPNTIEGNIVLTNNRGGLELGGNHIAGSAVIIGTAGSPPAWADSGIEVEGNTIGGSLACSTNTPAPINDTHANAVRGIKSGQCSGL